MHQQSISFNHLFSPKWISSSTLVETKMEKWFAHENRKGEIQRGEFFLDLCIFLNSQLENRTKISMIIEKKPVSQPTYTVFPKDSVEVSFFDSKIFFHRIVDIHNMKDVIWQQVCHSNSLATYLFFHSKSPSYDC